jgi:hypothetical protein
MSADADKATNTDHWPPGLHFSGKRLNVKTVRRAADFGEVLPVCLAHNLREGNEAHRHRSPIDPARTGLNEVLRGSASLPVSVELVRGIFDELGIVPARADAIAGIELVFQPPDGHDTPAFWSECLSWVDGRYQHVVSAVVHRDQKRPHLHVLVLAVAGAKLAGNDLTAGSNQFTIQRREFMAHVFATLGLRPNRRAADPLKRLALSTGKGARTAAGAARRDAELSRKVGAEWKRPDVCIGVAAADVHRGSTVEGTDPYAPENHRPLILRSVSTSEAIQQNGPQTPVFKATSATPMTPCPKPLQAGQTGTRSDPQDTAARLENIGRLFARCRAIPAPKTADFWRHRRPPAVLTPTLSGWC